MRIVQIYFAASIAMVFVVALIGDGLVKRFRESPFIMLALLIGAVLICASLSFAATSDQVREMVKTWLR